MNKYYELTVELTENGWKKRINESEVIKIKNGKIERDCGTFTTSHKFVVDKFWISPTKSKARIDTLDQSKLDTYYEQAKDMIIKQLQQEQKRISKLLEAASCAPCK